MTAPNPAAGALPGWRGTDPDGGTWVLTEDADAEPWIHVDARGQWDNGPRPDMWRTQEEAEAAGLVPLVAETQPVLSSAIFAPKPRLTIADLRFEPAAPAPLDPDNPDHLRQVADVLEAMPGETFQAAWESLNERIFRLEDAAAEKAREAEQDAADRKRADEFIAAATPGSSYTPDHLRYAYLTGIRAERARQEAEK